MTPAPGCEEGEDFADGGFPGAGLGQRQVSLDLVAVAPAVLVLQHVAGFSEVGDDAVGAAFGDAQTRRDVAQSRARVVGDAQQDPGVVSQETPVRHTDKGIIISGKILLVLNYKCSLRSRRRDHPPMAASY